MYEIFEHTADLGLRLSAPTLDELFAEAGRGLFAVIVANPQDVHPTEAATFRIPGKEADFLLLDWLSELLFTFDSRHMLFAEFDVRINAKELVAIARGEPVDRQRHQLDHEVKAVTYHRLKVEQTPAGWQAEVILDI